MDKSKEAAEYLLSILRPIVKCPDNLRVDFQNDSSQYRVFLDVIPDPEDMGFLIGYKGSHVSIMKDFMTLWSKKNLVKVDIHVGGRPQMMR